MAQTFHRSFNVVSKITILGAVLLIVLAGWIGAEVVRSPAATNAYVAVEQPVPFSHQHHVGDLGIDCRYCHTSVEESASAGMPDTKTCMNCHSQIWVNSDMLKPVRDSYTSEKQQSIEWVRVHNLADFVYFNHSIHVQKGVGCASCHGRVDKMPLTWQVHSLQMNWCLECHREPERFIRPREEVFNMAWEPPANDPNLRKKLVKDYGVKSKTSCSVCHR